MNKLLRFAALIGAIVSITSGCATNRSEVQLSMPVAPRVQAAAPKGVTVAIRSVKDERVFENGSSDPSIPSLGFYSTQELKSRAIARKRNGFGMALGDVVLQDGQTVPAIVQESLSTAFQQAGYRVAKEATATSPTLFIDVRVRKFWAWMTPGFWALTFESRIEADLSIEGKATPISIQAYATESRQLGTDSAWMEIIGKGLQDFQTKAGALTLP